MFKNKVFKSKIRIEKEGGNLSRSKEVYTYGFSKDQRWPEGICPVPLDSSVDGTIDWPHGPIVVHLDSSAEFVSKVFGGKSGRLTTAVVIPHNRWVPPERHLAYFDKQIPDGDENAILAFAKQEKQA